MKSLLLAFPRLASGNFSVTSPPTTSYNCIAWAAGDASRWWWPVAPYYWPPEAPYETTMDAFLAAYGTIGFVQCTGGDLEAGFVKVALFVDSKGKPTHAARQLSTGRWTSKLGTAHDIEHHTVDGVEGAAYGTVVAFMKKLTT